MPVKLNPPVEIRKHMEKTDKAANITDESQWTWASIRQAAQGENEIREGLFAQIERVFNEENSDVVVKTKLSFSEIRRKEVYLTLSACNLLGPTGKPLWEFENKRVKSEKNFLDGWAILEPHIAEELHSFVIEANPHWVGETTVVNPDSGEEETTSGEETSQTS